MKSKIFILLSALFLCSCKAEKTEVVIQPVLDSTSSFVSLTSISSVESSAESDESSSSSSSVTDEEFGGLTWF